jgi:hypothetical protein
MSAAAKERKVSDMTVKELKSLIKDTLQEFIDPDHGLDLRPEVEKSLKRSIRSKQRTPVEKVASPCFSACWRVGGAQKGPNTAAVAQGRYESGHKGPSINFLKTS